MVPLATGCASSLGKHLDPLCSLHCTVVAVATLDVGPTVLLLVVLCLWGILPKTSANHLSGVEFSSFWL